MAEVNCKPTFADLFSEYESEIRAVFERICREFGIVCERATTLKFTEIKTPMLFRSVPSKRRVLADWRGVASLWAVSQAVARVVPAMFKARRSGAGRLDLPGGIARSTRPSVDRIRQGAMRAPAVAMEYLLSKARPQRSLGRSEIGTRTDF